MDVYYDKYDSERRSKYSKCRRLGEGAFGDVYNGLCVADNSPVALKYVRLPSRNKTIPRAVFREIEALRQCECPEIIKLLDIYPEETNLVLVLEYLPFDLAKYIDQSRDALPPPQIKYILFKILSGLAYCHSHHLVHRDIKPSNILLSLRGEVKLADFGLARILSDTSDMSHQISTRWYRAPEILFGARRYDTGVDLWAVGAIAAELLALKPLFAGNNDIDQIFRVFQVLGTPTTSSWPEAYELPDFNKIQFPPMTPLNLRLLLPEASQEDIIFLRKFLQLSPKQRALNDDYFLVKPYPHFCNFDTENKRISEAEIVKSMQKMTPQEMLSTVEFV